VCGVKEYLVGISEGNECGTIFGKIYTIYFYRMYLDIIPAAYPHIGCRKCTNTVCGVFNGHKY
jgi:hypothetical protein